MRIDGWDAGLLAVIERHQAGTYVPGSTDCFMLAMDAAQALTGVRPYPKVRYATDAGALKVMKRHGFASLREAVAALFAERPAGHWQRGDIAVLPAPTQTGDTLGLVYGAVILCRQGHELRQLPLSAATIVFAVE